MSGNPKRAIAQQLTSDEYKKNQRAFWKRAKEHFGDLLPYLVNETAHPSMRKVLGGASTSPGGLFGKTREELYEIANGESQTIVLFEVLGAEMDSPSSPFCNGYALIPFVWEKSKQQSSSLPDRLQEVQDKIKKQFRADAWHLRPKDGCEFRGDLFRNFSSAWMPLAVGLYFAMNGQPVPLGVFFTGDWNDETGLTHVSGILEKCKAASSVGAHTMYIPEQNIAGVRESHEFEIKPIRASILPRTVVARTLYGVSENCPDQTKMIYDTLRPFRDREYRAEGRRTELRNRLRKFIRGDGEDASNKTLLLGAKPGWGKSAFIADFVHDYLSEKKPSDPSLIFHAFIPGSGSNNRHAFLESIALGFAGVNQLFSKFLLSPENSKAVLRGELSELFQHIGKSRGEETRKKCILVLDALDQVDDAELAAELCNMMTKPSWPENLRLIVTVSTSSPAWHQLTGESISIDLDLDEKYAEETASVIRKYCEEHLKKIFSEQLSAKEIVEYLDLCVERSENNFLWAATTMRKIAAKASAPEALTSFTEKKESWGVPDGLAAYYRNSIQRLFPNAREFKAAKRIFSVFNAAGQPVPSKIWKRIRTMIREDFEDEGRTERRLRQFFRVEEDGSVKLFHSSFSDWLRSCGGLKRGDVWRINNERGEKLLADACMGIFEEYDGCNGEDIECPFTARELPRLLKSSGNKSDLKKVLSNPSVVIEMLHEGEGKGKTDYEKARILAEYWAFTGKEDKNEMEGKNRIYDRRSLRRLTYSVHFRIPALALIELGRWTDLHSCCKDVRDFNPENPTALALRFLSSENNSETKDGYYEELRKILEKNNAASVYMMAKVRHSIPDFSNEHDKKIIKRIEEALKTTDEKWKCDAIANAETITFSLLINGKYDDAKSFLKFWKENEENLPKGRAGTQMEKSLAAVRGCEKLVNHNVPCFGRYVRPSVCDYQYEAFLNWHNYYYSLESDASNVTQEQYFEMAESVEKKTFRPYSFRWDIRLYVAAAFSCAQDWIMTRATLEDLLFELGKNCEENKHEIAKGYLALADLYWRRKEPESAYPYIQQAMETARSELKSDLYIETKWFEVAYSLCKSNGKSDDVKKNLPMNEGTLVPTETSLSRVHGYAAENILRRMTQAHRCAGNVKEEVECCDQLLKRAFDADCGEMYITHLRAMRCRKEDKEPINEFLQENKEEYLDSGKRLGKTKKMEREKLKDRLPDFETVRWHYLRSTYEECDNALKFAAESKWR